MEKRYMQVKSNIILILAIMIFMFTLCFVLYSTSVNNEIDINTSIELNDGNDILSQNLESIIPTSSKIDKNIKTAYQNSVTTYKDIDNNIYLAKAYKLASNNSYKNLNNILKKMYGNNLFIINNDFNVNGQDSCKYDGLLKIYNCQSNDYKGIIYNTYRHIEKVSINNNEYYLTENIIFYSMDNSTDQIKYNIYTNSEYNESINEFSSQDVTNSNLTFEEYISNNYNNYANMYRSKFILIKNNYQWINTERLK